MAQVVYQAEVCLVCSDGSSGVGVRCVESGARAALRIA
eukprot:CAMPEP_0202778468 /NCGR_PEP_ID=MMETSP1388-20130828/54727_1 /ASSEMBLY_ACC=CAM_ASM_000864 /TAXON_ID=37098 /ORGANISM="Isochrysis sp, Strain CCMP1244" /LENGTH=37 /DNA_ID= /DNA_START= /DNA_END= /DNA_ORIENTATION=